MTLTPTLKFDPSRGSLVESKNSRLTALWKGLFFFFFFFFFQFFGGRYTHPTFWNVNFSMFFFLFSKWFRYGWKFSFFFKILYMRLVSAQYFHSKWKDFFIGLFCKFNFWKYRIFSLSSFFYYFAIVPFILNFEFWNREDSFLFFYIIMHVFSSLTKFYAIFN